jgi:hypothetical protein
MYGIIQMSDSLSYELIRSDRQLFERLQTVAQDQEFQAARERLNMETLSNRFNCFSGDIIAYNKFHMRERRLWSVKIGKGEIPEELETAFRESIPSGIENYRRAFNSMESCLCLLEEAGMASVINRHIRTFTEAYLFREETLMGSFLGDAMRELGCSATMIEEFKSVCASTEFDLLRISSERRFEDLRPILSEAVEAQAEILEYTRENGFSYLRGRCNPPAWAITISSILSAAGISIAAWLVVAIVAIVIVIVILICALRILPDILQQGCDFVFTIFSSNF